MMQQTSQSHSFRSARPAAGMVLIGALLSSAGLGQQTSMVSVFPSYRIYPSNVTQTETFITRHPHNPSIMFASANTINLATAFISEGVYVTTDGGTTWRGNDTCTGTPIGFHRGDPGIAIDKNGTFILIRLAIIAGLYSHTSTNLGLSWTGQRQVASNDQDRATLVSDGEPTSAFYGRSYAVWVRFAPPYPFFFAYTDDGGTTWSDSVQVNSPPQWCRGGEASIGPAGRVNACWAGVIGTSPYTEDFVGFATSTSGGATWTVVENAFDANGIAGTLPQKTNIRVNGLPRIDTDRSGGVRNGWIYIVTTDRNLSPAGSDPDIILHRSTNNGATWSAGVRVNQDALNNGKIQYFPAIHVDEGGGVNVLYYDDRNTTSDSAGVYLSRSDDGGMTWMDHRISDRHFKPLPIGGLGQGYQGDNIGMTSANGTLWPVWMDNSTGIYQIWTAPVLLSTLSAGENRDIPIGLTLRQNYPNPFNPATSIEYSLPTASHIQLTVHTTDGKNVEELVDGWKEAGTHRAVFDTRGRMLASGVYFVRLRSQGYTLTRPMLLLK